MIPEPFTKEETTDLKERNIQILKEEICWLKSSDVVIRQLYGEFDPERLDVFLEAANFFSIITGIPVVEWGLRESERDEIFIASKYLADHENLETIALQDEPYLSSEIGSIVEDVLCKIFNYYIVCFESNKPMLTDIKLSQFLVDPHLNPVFVDVHPFFRTPYYTEEQKREFFPIEVYLSRIVRKVYVINEILCSQDEYIFGERFFKLLSEHGYPTDLDFWNQFLLRKLIPKRNTNA